MTCYFCQAQGTIEDIDHGWIPSFFDGEEEICHPVCPACVTLRLRLSPDEEWERFHKGK